MGKKSLILLVIAAFVMSLGLGVSMSLADNGPEEIVLGADGKKPATFPHKAHQEKSDCGTCHHKDDGGKRVALTADELGTIAKCDSCHNADFANEKLRTWKDIGHGQCKDCHTKMKDQGAPTKCTDCHKKE